MFCIMIKVDVDVREFPAETIDCPKCLHLCYNWGRNNLKRALVARKICDRSCGERLKDMNDHCSCAHNLSSLKIKQIQA